MNHYVLTRSAFAPDVHIELNRRRLQLLREVTARSLASQTAPFTWVVALHPRDPLRADREAIVRELDGVAIDCTTRPVRVPWSNHVGSYIQQLAASAYFADWRSAMTPGPRLQMRLDDDDAIATDYLARIQAAARRCRQRRIFVAMSGIRTDGQTWAPCRDATRLMQNLFTPADDDLCVYDFGHRRAASVAPVDVVSVDIGWLYLRHVDAISDDFSGSFRIPLSDRIRQRFAINWGALA